MRKALSILFMVLSIKIYAQVPDYYHSRFGGNEDEVGYNIIQALDSGYLVVGQTSGFNAIQTGVYIAKLNKLAHPKWQKSFGGTLSDVGKSLVELSDSSIIAVGYTNSFGNGGYDAYMIRVDKNGNLLWQKTFGGIDWDFAYSVNKTSDGNLIICGSTFSFGRGGKDAFILKMDYSGTFLWNKIYGSKNDDELKEIIQTNDGGYIAAGTTKSYGDSLGDIWVTKFNASGDSTWFITRGGNKRDVGNSIVQAYNFDYFVAGGSESYGNGQEDAYLFKLANNSNFLWDRFEGLANEDEEVVSIKNVPAIPGGIVFCYTTNELFGFKKDTKSLLFDASGYYVNGGRVGSPEDEEAFAVANCFDKGFITVGSTNGFNSSFKREDVFIVKFDSLMNGPGNLILKSKEIRADGAAGIKIYPTPFNGKITIVSSDSDPFSRVELVDINGRIVFESSYQPISRIDIENLDLVPGMYCVRVVAKSGVYTTKLVCKK